MRTFGFIKRSVKVLRWEGVKVGRLKLFVVGRDELRLVRV
jgi:hypothetical protein|tara:strand:- start:497 stop:616 length:120 start_codon:yes stop_codon:yes gene_type:complete